MSGQTPAQRLRTKTSDITDFFRGAGQSSTQTRRESIVPPSLEVPQSDNEGGTGKKKITRIPLFGRTRKISTASTSSSPYASTNLVRPSSDTTDLSSRAPSADRERRPSEPLISQTISQSRMPSSPSSFGSKLAARFNPAQSKKRPVTSSGIIATAASSSRTSLLSPNSGLVPPSDRPSVDSGSSVGSKARSTTPRPARPMITVSMTDNLDEFKDLFTQEVPKPTPIKAPKPTFNVTSDAEMSSKSSPPPSPITFASTPSIYRRGHTPASALAAAVRDKAAHERQSSTSSKSSRKTPESDKGSSSERQEGRSTPRLSSPRESPRPVLIDKEKGLPQPAQRRPSIVAVGSSQLPESSSGTVRSRIKSSGGSARTKPPSIPLPQLPPNATPSGTPSQEYPPSPVIDQTDFSEAESRKSRSRANTIASIPELPTVPASPTPPKSSLEAKHPPELPFFLDDEIFDVDTASPDQLRRALRSRNKHVDDLAALLLKKEEEWMVERRILEKKVASLQRDLVRRESEITGLKLIINDEDILQRPKPIPSSILNLSRLSPMATAVQDSDQETYSSPSSPPARRLHYGSDSGAESLRASGGSGTESTGSHLRSKKIQRFSGVNEMKYSGSTRRAPRLPPGLHEKSLPETPPTKTKRASIMSTTSSASSSSSLLPPSPSVTMSSLSAIPEGNTPNPRGFSSDSEDRRSVRAAHRISTSSMTSSSTAASSSYSGNFKRSRPTSIAQVLDKTPNVENVLDKLRPFA